MPDFTLQRCQEEEGKKKRPKLSCNTAGLYFCSFTATAWNFSDLFSLDKISNALTLASIKQLEEITTAAIKK